MAYPKRSEDCDYCNEFRQWNEDDLKECERAKLRGMNWTAHIGDVVIPRMREYHEHCKRYHDNRNSKQYAFTFTTNKSKEEIQTTMIESCYKLYKQQTCPILEGEAYLEYTEEGRPHIHGWYETVDGGRVFAKVFARCWPAWKEKRGQTKFAGGYHEQMKTNRYKGYASAEGRVIVRKNKTEGLVIDAPSEESAAQVCQGTEACLISDGAQSGDVGTPHVSSSWTPTLHG